DAGALLEIDGARIRPDAAHDDPHERGFTGAVAADHADALAGLDGEGRAVEEDARSDCVGEVGDADQGHGRGDGRRGRGRRSAQGQSQRDRLSGVTTPLPVPALQPRRTYKYDGMLMAAFV